MKNISFRDLGLSLWIIMAMLFGLLISMLLPQTVNTIEQLSIHGTNIPLAFFLIAMLYPTFAKVPIEKVGMAFKQPKILGLSLILNWIIGPILMFLCAILFLHNHPDYMIGLILVGIARCIAMVVLWNNMAGGEEATCAALVAFNSLFQCLTYALYAYFFLWIVLPFLGFHVIAKHIAFQNVLSSVGLYLGIPFIAGMATQLLRLCKSAAWYKQFTNTISPIGLYALLATVAMLFMFNGKQFIQNPGNTILIALPLVLYFGLMFIVSLSLAKSMGIQRDKCIPVAFTGASNNFELAIAVAIATFGVHSHVAFAAIIGPLIEVPVMLILVRFVTRTSPNQT